jgi:curved DNA-binding protein CbpA
MKDYYQILGVTPTATASDIKRAYRKLALIYHPDRNPDPAAEQFFKEVNEAYDVLSDVQQRSWYDFKQQTPQVESVIQQQPRKHRDPAYRRKYNPNVRPAHASSRAELIRKYHPYFKWTNWFGIFLMIVFAFDYTLPMSVYEEKITAIKYAFEQGHGHDVLITNNHKISVGTHADDFYIGTPLKIEITPLLRVIRNITNTKTGSEFYPQNIYSAAMFLPFLLFVSSILGLLVRNRIDHSFNISVTSGVLIIFVLYLIFLL